MIDIDQAARLISEKLIFWMKTVIRFIPELVAAVLVILLANFLARYVRRVVVRGLTTLSDNQSLVNLTGALVQVVVMAVGLFIGLGMLGLDKTVTSLLAGAGVLALAVGFAFQDLTTNFISGTMIALARPVQVGDVVETNGFLGRVLDIKLRSIILDNFQGQTIEIPTKDVFQKPIINYSRVGQRRVELTAGVSYLDDLGKAQRVAQSAIARLPFVLPDRPVELYYRNLSDNTVQFVLWFWIDPATTNPQAALSEAIKALKVAFEENSVLFLFPPHTFDLKQRLAAKPAGS